MPFAIFHSKTFDEELETFSDEFKNWVDKMEDQLVENPFVGDHIRVPWFREKKREPCRGE